MADIHVMDDGFGEPLLVTPVSPGMTRAELAAAWERLEEISANGYETCTECSAAIPKDERGDVLDSSGRCDECRP